MDRQPITLNTLGDLLDNGYRLSSWCPECHRHGEIDLASLVERLGREQSYVRPSLRFRCRECGTVTEHRQIAPPMRDGFPLIQAEASQG